MFEEFRRSLENKEGYKKGTTSNNSTYRYQVNSATRLVSVCAANEQRFGRLQFEHSDVVLALFRRFSLHPAQVDILLARWPLESLLVNVKRVVEMMVC